MTNSIHTDNTPALDLRLAALAPIGARRRPVKVVEHPTFRAARARLDAPLTVLRVPVVALNRPLAVAGCIHTHPACEAA